METDALVKSYLRTNPNANKDDGVKIEVRPARAGVGAAYAPPTALSTKVQNRLVGHKRRVASLGDEEPIKVKQDDSGDDQDSRSAAVRAKSVDVPNIVEPKKKKASFKPPPNSSSNKSTIDAAVNLPVTPSAHEEAALSAEGNAEVEKPKRLRKKVRSRQKNLRKDNRPEHLKPGSRAARQFAQNEFIAIANGGMPLETNSGTALKSQDHIEISSKAKSNPSPAIKSKPISLVPAVPATPTAPLKSPPVSRAASDQLPPKSQAQALAVAEFPPPKVQQAKAKAPHSSNASTPAVVSQKSQSSQSSASAAKTAAAPSRVIASERFKSSDIVVEAFDEGEVDDITDADPAFVSNW